MTDIIVTIPKGYDFLNKLVRLHNYWRVPKWPKDTEPGEHIYFVQNGEIRYRATISENQEGWPKEIDFENIEELPYPRERMVGFRGYRYRRDG